MILDIIKYYQGECIIEKNRSFTFDELSEKIKELRILFKQKFKPNDRVVIYSDYSFFSISLLISLSKYSINIIPIVKTTEQEYLKKIESVLPDWILSFNSKQEIVIEKKLISKPKDDINFYFNNTSMTSGSGVVLFSSGTSGKPKVMIQNFTKLIKSTNIPKRQKSLKFILLLMFDHIGGLNTLLSCLISGSPFVIPKDRNPHTIINLIRKHKINILPTTPTFLFFFLMEESISEKKLNSLKLITYGTERMPEFLLKKLNRLLPNVKLLQNLGTSETVIIKTKS